MIRRVVTVTLAALCVASAVPAHAAAPLKVYLNQLSDDCNTADFQVTATADGPGSCVMVPRVLVDGTGLDSTNESFITSKRFKTFKVDTSKPLTGTFALFGSSGLRLAEGPAVVKAELTIKVAKKKVGSVVIDGVSTPAAHATKSFSIKLPASLKNVTTNSISVSVTWISCAGLCGVATGTSSTMSIPVK